MKLCGTLPDSPLNHISMGTINTNGMNNNKMDQLLAFMDSQSVDVWCLTDTSFSRKAPETYSKDAGRELGPNAAICAIGYLPRIQTLFRMRRKK